MVSGGKCLGLIETSESSSSTIKDISNYEEPLESVDVSKDNTRDKGYETTMVFVTTDLETALRRNKERERTLPDKLIHQNFEVIEQRLGEYQRMFNDVLVIDNSESTQMSMPAQLVHVEKNIRKFLQ